MSTPSAERIIETLARILEARHQVKIDYTVMDANDARRKTSAPEYRGDRTTP